MNQKVFSSLILGVLLSVSLNASQQSDKGFKDLDCEIEGCPVVKPAEPKVIEKEKIIYVDKPVVQEKIVEKVVEKEKIIYVEKEPKVEQKPQAQTVVVPGRKYEIAFIDVSSPNDAKFIEDYITTVRGASGLDWGKFSTRFKGREYGRWSVKISASIELPEGIDGKTILVKQRGDEHRFIKIDGQPLADDDTHIVLENRYQASRKIPFVFTVHDSYQNGEGMYRWLEKYMTSIAISFANKPDKRGEKEVFVPARFFIEE